MCKFQITEDKANAHAGMPFLRYASVCRTDFLSVFGRKTKGNSPFGAWVVCVYRLLGMHSLTLVNATIYAFFVFIQNLAKFIVE